MGPGCFARIIGWLAVLAIVLFASSFGQHILYGEFYEWTLWSPQTLIPVFIAALLTLFAQWLGVRREEKTQASRDAEAQAILDEADGKVERRW